LRGFHVHAGRDLLDQGNDVAHAQDAPGVPLGVKHLQAVNLLAGTANLIGAPVTWRTDSAAPPRESPSVLVRMMPVSGMPP
jgi:hypothetical protein